MRAYKRLMEAIDRKGEDRLKHLKDESSYNHNFYLFESEGITYKLLGESDDIDTTTWYWVQGDALLVLGESQVGRKIQTCEHL